MKPYIICHMMSSIDGRIDCDMTEQLEGGDDYYRILEQLNVPTRISGKITAERHFALSGSFVAKNTEPIKQDTFWKAVESKNGYSVVMDTKGTLLWSNDEQIDGKPLVCALSQKVSKEYLHYLRQRNISYIVAGENHIDLNKITEILANEFDSPRIAIIGGGAINGSFLTAGLLNEISLILAPGIDGRVNQPCLFDGLKETESPIKLKLVECTPINNTLWIRYKVKK